jgi:hypothetical protein
LGWKLITEYPAWLSLPCILLGITYALVLYYRERKSEFPAALRYSLATLRMVSVSVIALMLLSPFIRSATSTSEEPVIIIAQDNSRSLLASPDSIFYRSSYLDAVDRLAGDLSRHARVRKYIFGEKVTPVPEESSFSDLVNYSGRLTDFSDLFEELQLIYANRNVGALVIASDGIYNSGFNPVYPARSWPFPIYTVAMGDTSQRKDLLISRVNYNRTVFLDNKFPLEVHLHAHECQSNQSVLKVMSGDKILYSRELTFSSPSQDLVEQILLEASEPGLKRLRVSAAPLEGEVSIYNNTREVFVEVLEARFKILLLYNAPHPDISALRQAALWNENYELEAYLSEEFTGPAAKYDLIILHDLPSSDHPLPGIMKEIRDRQLPVLFIIGSQADLPGFNQLQTGITIISDRKIIEEALPEINDNFVLFAVSDVSQQIINDFPPLWARSADYRSGPGVNIALHQRIGSIKTSRPLAAFVQTLDTRYGIIAGEGIWRWRIRNYALRQDHQAFDEFFNKTFQYLSMREVKKNLRIYYSSSLAENERVVFDAEFFNEAYELSVAPEIEMVLSSGDSLNYPFAFTSAMQSYHLDAGTFPPGSYTFLATARLGEQTYQASGEFFITPLEQELIGTVADHSLMNTLAEAGGGMMFAASDLERAGEEILSRKGIRPVIYTQNRFNELIDFPQLLIIVLALVAIEWFIRKWTGNY